MNERAAVRISPNLRPLRRIARISAARIASYTAALLRLYLTSASHTLRTASPSRLSTAAWRTVGLDSGSHSIGAPLTGNGAAGNGRIMHRNVISAARGRGPDRKSTRL